MVRKLYKMLRSSKNLIKNMLAFFTFSFANLAQFFSCFFSLEFWKSSRKAVIIDHQVSFNIFHIYTHNKEKATQLTQIFSLEKYVLVIYEIINLPSKWWNWGSVVHRAGSSIHKMQRGNFSNTVNEYTYQTVLSVLFFL